MKTQIKLALAAAVTSAMLVGCATTGGYGQQYPSNQDPNQQGMSKTSRGALIGAAVGAVAGLLSGNDATERRRRTVRTFRRGHEPEKVAAAIVDAIERNRAVVPVGFEARAGWWFPGSIWIARIASAGSR